MNLTLDPTQDPQQDRHCPYLGGHPAPDGPPAFERHLDAAGRCWITFDQPGSRVNLWSETTLREFAWHLEQIERDPAVRALILRSGKPDTFIAGADLKAIRSLNPQRLEQLIWLGQATFDRLARIAVPKVAVIHGACAGGGFEVALACDWRLASDDSATRIGLPETQLGLLPGWGGCVRLPRLLGLRRALDIILTGRLHPAPTALKKGLVHEVAPQAHLETLATQLADGPLPLQPFHIDTIPGLAPLIARFAERRIRQQTRSLYPAPLRALRVTTRALRCDTDAALRLERVGILDLASTRHAHHLITLFFNREAAAKQRPKSGIAVPIHDTVVIGAGVMGAGITQALASCGLRVLMKDLSSDALAAAMTRLRTVTATAVGKHTLTPKQARETLDRISLTHQSAPLARYPLIIEAATEDLALKKKIFAQLDRDTAPDTILATNTSALPVGELAASVSHPERVIGLHFFNPVHRMPLVEIVTLPLTHPDVIATAVAFVQSIGKVPVVVQDRPGFVVNRILVPYLAEAVRYYTSGASAAHIDRAMLDFGMPMGPLRLLDEIGLDVAQDVGDTLHAAFPDRLPRLDALSPFIAAGHLGRKSGQGFYRHTGRHEKEVRTQNPTSPHPDAVQQHLSGLLSAEAQRCLDEQVAATAADIDLAMVLGTGYAPFRGGPLAFAHESTPKTPDP